MPMTAPWSQADFAYTDRPSKAAYIARAYAPALQGRILDVGCGQRLLARRLPECTYTGVDLSPEADVKLNLDREDLPFGDRSFDCVVATDVLEHLERLHHVFDACCRIASRHVLVSLPNPAGEFMLSVAQGRADNFKYYGLPIDPPEDRHRWFFSSEQAAHFLRVRGQRNGMAIERLDVAPGAELVWSDGAGRNRLGTNAFRMSTTWALLTRRTESDRVDPIDGQPGVANGR